MSTWLGAQRSGLPAGSGPSASWPDPIARCSRTRLGVAARRAGGGGTAAGWGVTPDLSGVGSPRPRAGVPQRAGGTAQVASAAVSAPPRQFRCGSGFDEGAAAGVGGLVGGVDAACASSYVLGEVTKPGVGRDKSRRSGALGPGADPAPRRWARCARGRRAPLMFGDGGDVEVSPRRCAHTRRGVPRRPVGLRVRRRGVGGGDRGAGGRDGVADRGAGRRQPVVDRGGGAGLRRPAGVRLVDDDHRLDHQRRDRVGHRRGRQGHPPARAATDSFRVDRGRSLRMAGGQTARGLPCS